jgi:hypothetical protein
VKSTIITIFSKLLKFLKKLAITIAIRLTPILTSLTFLFGKVLYYLYKVITYDKIVKGYYKIITIFGKLLKFLEKLAIIIAVILTAILTFLIFLFKKVLHYLYKAITYDKIVEGYYNFIISFFLHCYGIARSIPWKIYIRL